MLVLTRTPAREARRRDDSLLVLHLPNGQLVRLWVMTATRGDVRVAVEAQRDVGIERGEVYRETRGADPHRDGTAAEWEQWYAAQTGGRA